MAECYLRQDLATGDQALAADPAALLAWARELAEQAAPGDVYRNKEGRKTLRFDWRGRSWFLKLHSGTGWGEIFKNLLQGRLPVLGASNEFRAVQALEALGVDTMAVGAYASLGRNPATVQSLIVTEDLVGTVSLEDYCADWARRPPAFAVRLRLLRKLADSAGRMHRAGINHRDFYLCHFHLDQSTLSQPSPRCCVIDLHRAQIRRRTPRRWQVKDLAGLYFSAMDCGLQRRDLLRFMARYTEGGLRVALGRDRALWQDVERRARRLYRREHDRLPPEPGS
ncbi:lipopolysaccharide core heptose(I) kinase RfaP [Seongchinamella sediminis]|uniref:Lipopolysaccharide core heptose(I) kinase n=1 Tax=Seongchinamella sediminis TaxID=2283635 RepID=A0A3L7DZN6_9GAMM|nr:lipopolysaccharide core heptose(I) kinase RfaP [Seongchinamella sediminis]RLQ22129.1 lipopolysaccharide core heptose(I) kinase RfaP [Seongchinamella sediminis]